jgi:ribonuclease P/MRP protein subunit RPP1
LVFSLEEKGRKDFMHQRGSGLDHILAKLAHQNNIILGFSLNSIINSNKRNVILGRIMQNIKLCRKYKVKTVIGSFTQNPMEMRSPQDIVSLFTTLGMTQKEVKDSLNNVL